MWRVVVVAGLVGCSSTPELTCAVLTDPANCFAQQVAALVACMPMRATPALLSTDRKTCMYADGAHLEFFTPLPSTDIYSAEGLTMTVFAPDGSKCSSLYYVESSDGTIINVDRAARWDETAGFPNGVTLFCPSEKYEGQLHDVDTCRPSVQLSLTPPVYSVTLTGAPAPLFSCQ